MVLILVLVLVVVVFLVVAPTLVLVLADLWIESIGLVAGFIGIVAWIPQIRRVWVDEKEEGISLPTFLAVTVSLSLWLVYGIIVNSIAMIVSNILTLAFIIAGAASAWAATER